MTNLHIERPTWLAMLHADLDRAVWAALGWVDQDPAMLTEDAVLSLKSCANTIKVTSAFDALVLEDSEY